MLSYEKQIFDRTCVFDNLRCPIRTLFSSFTQLAVGILFAVSALCLHAQLRPFAEDQETEFWMQVHSFP